MIFVCFVVFTFLFVAFFGGEIEAWISMTFFII